MHAAIVVPRRLTKRQSGRRRRVHVHVVRAERERVVARKIGRHKRLVHRHVAKDCAQLATNSCDDAQRPGGRLEIEHDHPAGAQQRARLDKELVREQRMGMLPKIRRVDDDAVEELPMRVRLELLRHEPCPVVVQNLDAGIIERRGELWEMAAAHLHHNRVKLDDNDPLYTAIRENAGNSAAVAATHDKNIEPALRQIRQRHERNHLMVHELIAARDHECPVNREHAPKERRLVNLDKLERRALALEQTRADELRSVAALLVALDKRPRVSLVRRRKTLGKKKPDSEGKENRHPRNRLAFAPPARPFLCSHASKF
eukprot:Amastigsp_a340067_31.p2 type:complete len:315 gc:universal Amastigsp_a340067_31:895-1839(+)